MSTIPVTSTYTFNSFVSITSCHLHYCTCSYIMLSHNELLSKCLCQLITIFNEKEFFRGNHVKEQPTEKNKGEYTSLRVSHRTCQAGWSLELVAGTLESIGRADAYVKQTQGWFWCCYYKALTRWISVGRPFIRYASNSAPTTGGNGQLILSIELLVHTQFITLSFVPLTCW